VLNRRSTTPDFVTKATSLRGPTWTVSPDAVVARRYALRVLAPPRLRVEYRTLRVKASLTGSEVACESTSIDSSVTVYVVDVAVAEVVEVVVEVAVTVSVVTLAVVVVEVWVADVVVIVRVDVVLVVLVGVSIRYVTSAMRASRELFPLGNIKA
jgi:hypothetical protein